MKTKPNIRQWILLTNFLLLTVGMHAQSSINAVASIEELLAKSKKALVYGDRYGSLRNPGKDPAIATLGMIGGEKAETILLDYVLDEEDRQTRFLIVKALGWMGTEKSVPFLEKELRNKANPYAHRHLAAMALLRITGKEHPCERTAEDVEFEKKLRERLGKTYGGSGSNKQE